MKQEQKKISCMQSDHHVIMENLKGMHEIIAKLINKSTVHYVDLPVHGNIGDLLIMQGTLEFIRRYKISCQLMASCENYNSAWLGKDDVLMFHGGGNLGDLYFGPQQIRERCISELPNNRIIILPQTVCFKNAENYERCIETFSSHKDLHIFVRDEVSFELARPFSKYIYLMPDMAHQLWPIRRNQRKPAKGTLGIMRTDEESVGFIPEACEKITDWPRVVGRNGQKKIVWLLNLIRKKHNPLVHKYLVNMEMKLWILYSGKFVKDAKLLFSRYERVVTDRLHAHILASLMDIPSVVFDNNYGKNSTYINSWMNRSEKVTIKNIERPPDIKTR
jgi:pyruvyl transferase EpsO